MQLKLENLNHFNNNIKTPQYDVEKIKNKTATSPKWLHFGAGNIFRGYIARLQDELLNLGLADSGIVACETFDYEIIDQIYRPYDNLVLLATLASDKPSTYRIISSIADAIKADVNDSKEYSKLKDVFVNPSLQMVSFTITEKGYNLKGVNGSYLDIVVQDMENGPQNCHHAMSIVCALLYQRYLKNAHPLALVSMDNCSHNGEKLQNAILDIASKWCEKGYVEKGFIDYLTNSDKISFPWSMIDKITPRPAEKIAEELNTLGIENINPVTTSKKTFIAPFVNAEEAEYLVIEDSFPNGKPALDKVGVYYTTRETVNKVETMKVTTCLNPLHTALAVYGVLLGYHAIYEEMKNPLLVGLIKGVAREGMKVVVDPKIISPQAFLDEVINKRLPNPSIPDAPERIATDTSLKVPVRYGETIKSYLKDDKLSLDDLVYIPLVIAGWFRYILGYDDNLNPYKPSNDPQLNDLYQILCDIDVNDPSYSTKIDTILANDHIFGMDLTKTPLKNKVSEMFKKMLCGKGAVVKTLTEYIQ